jgi:hypothetical protein
MSQLRVLLLRQLLRRQLLLRLHQALIRRRQKGLRHMAPSSILLRVVPSQRRRGRGQLHTTSSTLSTPSVQVRHLLLLHRPRPRRRLQRQALRCQRQRRLAMRRLRCRWLLLRKWKQDSGGALRLVCSKTVTSRTVTVLLPAQQTYCFYFDFIALLFLSSRTPWAYYFSQYKHHGTLGTCHMVICLSCSVPTRSPTPTPSSEISWVRVRTACLSRSADHPQCTRRNVAYWRNQSAALGLRLSLITCIYTS